MRKNERVTKILALLDEAYGTDDKCYLDHANDWQFLIAVMLSAQCTDKRVNLVTPGLFRAFPTIESLANAEPQDVEACIHSVGFYHDKARNIIRAMQRLHTVYQDTMPDTMEELLTLPGVGRKTANVILGNVFRKPSVVVDTHVKRISKKLGLTRETDPAKVEQDLQKILPKDHWILYNMQIITHGRTICTARAPKCKDCFLQEVCPAGHQHKGGVK